MLNYDFDQVFRVCHYSIRVYNVIPLTAFELFAVGMVSNFSAKMSSYTYIIIVTTLYTLNYISYAWVYLCMNVFFATSPFSSSYSSNFILILFISFFLISKLCFLSSTAVDGIKFFQWSDDCKIYAVFSILTDLETKKKQKKKQKKICKKKKKIKNRFC